MMVMCMADLWCVRGRDVQGVQEGIFSDVR